MKNSLYKDLQERNNIALFIYWLDGAHQLTFMGAPAHDLSQIEIADIERRLVMCFVDLQEYLEDTCGFRVKHLELSFDARGQRP